MASSSTRELRLIESDELATPSGESMRSTLAGFPTGVAVVAAQIDGRVVGLSASSLVSISLEPPLVSLSFARTSTTWPVLRGASQWGISVLSEGQSEVLARLRRPARDRFDGIEMTIGDEGDAFVRGSLAKLTVTPRAEIDAGDHVLTLLDVYRLDRTAGLRPLVFFDSAPHHLSY